MCERCKKNASECHGKDFVSASVPFPDLPDPTDEEYACAQELVNSIPDDVRDAMTHAAISIGCLKMVNGIPCNTLAAPWAAFSMVGARAFNSTMGRLYGSPDREFTTGTIEDLMTGKDVAVEPPPERERH